MCLPPTKNDKAPIKIRDCDTIKIIVQLTNMTSRDCRSYRRRRMLSRRIRSAKNVTRDILFPTNVMHDCNDLCNLTTPKFDSYFLNRLVNSMRTNI
jgi:transposase